MLSLQFVCWNPGIPVFEHRSNIHQFNASKDAVSLALPTEGCEEVLEDTGSKSTSTVLKAISIRKQHRLARHFN